jgi:large subunit ribosomal protein L1
MGKKKVAIVGKNRVGSKVKEIGKEGIAPRGQISEPRSGVATKEKKKTVKTRKASLSLKTGQRKGSRFGRRYLKAKKLVNKNKTCSPKEAVSLLVKTAWASFNESAEAHLVIKQKSFLGRVNFPYGQGKKKIIAIADEEETMAKIKSGNVDFDILLATPKVMTQLIPYARFLGPRGLMPNLKEGTITDDPAKKAKELEKAGTKIKTEKNYPLLHIVFGRLDQKEAELEKNLQALIKTVGPQNITKLVVTSTMGPGINVGV